MKFIAKISIGVILALTTTVGGLAHAQTNTIGATFKNAVNVTKETAAKNSALRNQLVTDRSSELQNKQKALVSQLSLNLLNLENIQTRIAAKTAEIATGTVDTTNIDAWLASSSVDITIAQNSLSAFASSVFATSSATENQSTVDDMRERANQAIADVNQAHDDLQSALDALAGILNVMNALQ